VGGEAEAKGHRQVGAGKPRQDTSHCGLMEAGTKELSFFFGRTGV
jgi:hypothetical protein